jgi:hypothetical protein
VIYYDALETKVTNTTTAKEFDELRSQNARLMATVKEYKSTIRRLEERLNATTSNNIIIKAANLSQQVNLETESLSDAGKTKTSDAINNKTDFVVETGERNEDDMLASFSSKMVNEPDFDPVGAIKDEFDVQAIDEDWAYEYESNMHDMFLSDENLLKSVDVQNIRCKTSLCELTVYSDSPHYFVANTVAKSLGKQKWRDKKALILFNDESKDGVMKFYVGKDKSSIQFN